MNKNNETKYDRINNEGGEGYNPIREARKQAEAEAARNTPINRDERKDQINRKLNNLDMNNTRHMVKYTELKAEMEAIKQAEANEFATKWTPEFTARVRAEWNGWVKAQGGKIPAGKVTRKLAEMGMTIDDLKKAIQINEKKLRDEASLMTTPKATESDQSLKSNETKDVKPKPLQVVSESHDSPKITVSEVREIQGNRSKRSQASDARQTNKNVRDINDPGGWIKNPGRYDIKGVDTKRKKKKKSAPKRKTNPTLGKSR